MAEAAAADRGGRIAAVADRVEVARLGRTHGLRGALRLFVTSDVPDRVVVGTRLWLEDDRELEVSWIDPSGRLVRFVGVTTVDQASELAGRVLRAERLTSPGLTLIDDLIGKVLVDQRGTDHGQVVAIQANPASELMVLGSGALVPTVFIASVDEQRIVVEVPDGLFD